MKSKIPLILVFFVFLSSCSSFDPASKITLQRNDIVILPRPQSISLESIKFDSAVIEGDSYFVLSPQEYQKLSINILKIITHSKDSAEIIKKYEVLIKNSNKK